MIILIVQYKEKLFHRHESWYKIIIMNQYKNMSR